MPRPTEESRQKAKKQKIAMKRLPTLIAVAALFTLGSAPAEAQSALAARTTLPPVTDGIIGNDEWQGATRLADFIQMEPRKGQPATQPTVGLFLFDDTHVYIAVTAYDNAPESITARLNNRDDPLNQDDSVTVYLDTFHDLGCFLAGCRPSDRERLDGGICHPAPCHPVRRRKRPRLGLEHWPHAPKQPGTQFLGRSAGVCPPSFTIR